MSPQRQQWTIGALGAGRVEGCGKDSYSAYVSEVYRAGLNSVHRSQVAAARSLGLTEWAALRYVILPQAVRNIIPPRRPGVLPGRRADRGAGAARAAVR